MGKVFNRANHTLPSDPIERRDLVRWVLNHPIWTVPVPRNKKATSNFFNELLGEDIPDYLPILGWENCIEMYPAYVNPQTHRIDEDDNLNTLLEVWVEAGPPEDISKDWSAPKDGWNEYNKYSPSHDVYLDCGAVTMEEALLELALRVKHYYGDYEKGPYAYVAYHKTSEHGLLKDK